MSYISNAPAGTPGSGTVTNTGTLTANKLTKGNGGADISSSGVDATNPLFNTLVAQPSTAVGALIGRVVLGGSEYGVEVQNKANNAHIAGIDGLGGVDGKLIRMNGSGSGVVTIQPAAAAGTWALTLPTDDGNNGQVLTTNGSGVCTWGAAGGASTFDAIGSGTNTTAAMVVDTGASLAATGTGTITATNGVAIVATADQGYFWSNGALGTHGYSALAANAIVASGQQVRACQFVLPIRMTVRHVTVSIQVAAGVAATVTVGIYDAAGTTKLIDSGTFDGNSNTVQTLAITGVTLPPGVYWFAQSASTQTTLTGNCFAALATAVGVINNQTAKKSGTAANAATAGVLPSALGAITGASFAPLGAVFEP